MNVMLKNIKSHPHIKSKYGGFFWGEGGLGNWQLSNAFISNLKSPNKTYV